MEDEEIRQAVRLQQCVVLGLVSTKIPNGKDRRS
jgi:hypothetical protein